MTPELTRGTQNPALNATGSTVGQPLAPRSAFPLLAGNPGLAYFDSAASAQKPLRVLERQRRFYEREYANIHRGVYPLSEASSEAYDQARARVARFLNADSREIVFTRNATEAINLVAHSFGDRFLKEGDLILVTLLEHHANIVPWQLARRRLGIRLKAVPIDSDGDLDLNALDRLLHEGPKLLAVTAAANTIGTIPPLADILEKARAAGTYTLVDAAQAAPHMKIDVKALNCDFLAITGHKLYGPDGIGALYARHELLEAMPPFMGGGGMIRSVTIDHTEFAEAPRRFEAGTPSIGPAIGLAEALDFIEEIGFQRIEAHDAALTAHALERLPEIAGLRIVGRPRRRTGIVSFTMDGLHPHDVGTLLGEQGFCLRSGHHCAQPLMDYFNIPGTARLSFAVHNGRDEIDRLVAALARVRQLLR